jgi:hypothetical protein
MPTLATRKACEWRLTQRSPWTSRRSSARYASRLAVRTGARAGGRRVIGFLPCCSTRPRSCKRSRELQDPTLTRCDRGYVDP